MERVGILVVCYGSRGVSMVDAFSRSENYKTEIYVADKQRNPFNAEKTKKQIVIPDLSVEKICAFTERYKEKIDFGIVGPEKPVIEGVRDKVEKETGIPMICPTKKYAIEGSKVAQRQLFQEIAPEVNPRFKVFDPNDYEGTAEVKKDVLAWVNQLNNNVVVKPDEPAAGKGVGVWGDHFNTQEQLLEHFFSNYKYGPVIIEEKIEGEESSFQAFCDGKHLVPLPETRDYKRAFEDDKGPNTGGMGSYKDVNDILPFMIRKDRENELRIEHSIFEKLKENGSNLGLRGISSYDAFIHTGKGQKILERNSRPGDPEIQNIIPILKDDFVDICYKIIEGSLTHIEIEKKATVVTYKAPPTYGGYIDVYPELVRQHEVNKPVDLTKAYKLTEKYGDNIRIYPGAMELRNGETYALTSRTVCVVGIGDNIQVAREISLEGIKAIKGGALWHRKDIAGKKHIQKSMEHMKKLRQS